MPVASHAWVRAAHFTEPSDEGLEESLGVWGASWNTRVVPQGGFRARGLRRVAEEVTEEHDEDLERVSPLALSKKRRELEDADVLGGIIMRSPIMALRR